MKKQGFTLAELLITLGIIGVAAALMSPAVSSFMPDKNKMLVMKIHNKIASATESMLENSELYYSGKDANGRASCFGLGCTHKSLDVTYNSFTGASKYPNILAQLSHIGKSNIVSNTDGSVTFVPLKGTTCTISSVVNSNGTVVSTATVNIGVSDKYCTYDATNCKVPNQYVFKIDTYGNIAPADKMSIAYLKNPNSYTNKNADKNVANSITTIPDYDTLMAVKGTGATNWTEILMNGEYETVIEVPEDPGNEDDGNNGNNESDDEKPIIGVGPVNPDTPGYKKPILDEPVIFNPDTPTIGITDPVVPELGTGLEIVDSKFKEDKREADETPSVGDGTSSGNISSGIGRGSGSVNNGIVGGVTGGGVGGTCSGKTCTQKTMQSYQVDNGSTNAVYGTGSSVSMY